MTRAVGYARRSNDKQDGYSIAAQRRAIESYCRDRGYELLEIYEDDGVSGAEWEKRRAFQRLLADAAGGRFDVLVIQEQGRLTRQPNIDRIMDMLVAVGVRVEATHDRLDWDTAAGRANTRMKGVLHAFYREDNAEKIRDRKREATEQGYQQGDPPYGYARGPDKTFVVVGAEAAIVREIFDHYLEGESPSAIAADLNRRGLRTRAGRLWTRDSIHGVLTNPTYAGLVHHRYRLTKRVIGRGKHAAIIPKDRFDAVQRRLASRRRGGSGRPYGRDPLPLTGVAFDVQGHPLAGAGRGLMRCYPKRMLAGTACRQRTAHVDLLEAQVGTYVSGMVVPSEAAEAIIAEAQRLVGPPPADRRKLERELRDLVRLLRDEYIEWEAFQMEAAPLKAQLRALDAPQTFDPAQAMELVLDQGGQWEAMERAERRTYVQTVFDRVVVDGDQIMEITPKPEWLPLFQIDRQQRFGGVRSCVGPAGFEPATERL